MEYSFSSKEKGISYWASPRAQTDSMPPLDNGTRSSMVEDSFNNFSELMNFDTYAGWCNSPSATDQMLASYGLSPFQSSPFASFDALSFAEHNSATFPDVSGTSNAVGNSYHCGDKTIFQQANSQCGYPSVPTVAEDLGAKPSDRAYQQNNISDVANYSISRPLSLSLDERMLKALSLLKGYSGGGILAQVWVPIRHGNQYILTTSEQPYLLDHALAGFREVSRTFTFSAEVKPGFPLGLPGRVFISKVPEWTSNVIYYSKAEYLRAQHAVDHKVRGSIALPVFDPTGMSCCAVLELVTMKEKPDFDSEMENVCSALQSVNLRSTTPPRLLPQCLSRNQKAALAEISDVLRAVCHAHRLPLALTWIPCSYAEEDADKIIKLRVREGSSGSTGKCLLCIEHTACYVNDKEMQGFVHTCAEHYIEEGQGIAGKALQSNHPFFFPDVKLYDITEYPLVHHARKYGLGAAVAIRLRSTFTGDYDYILEFFLPVSIKGSSEQQLLLNNLSGTMQRICKSLRTVLDAELCGGEGSKLELQKEAVPSFPPMSTSKRNSQVSLPEGNLILTDKLPFNASSSKNIGMESGSHHEQAMSGSRRQQEKKRSTAEKNVSLTVLQQYFSGSLKDAAKSIGVCPTTLKRICRQHGISRWPSRKINKVNRSLRKIQSVLDSVQGVEGGLKFDPAIGEFVSASSIINESDSRKVKVEEDECCTGTHREELMTSSIPVIEGSEDSKSAEMDAGLCQQASHGSGPWTSIENASTGLCFAKEGNKQDPNKGSMKFEDLDSHFVSQSLGSWAAVNEMDMKMEGEDGIPEQNQPTSCSMTDSSNGSGSMMHGSISSSPSFEDGKHSKAKTSCGGTGSKITVKAMYKEDTVRFKFEPSAGCFQLYEEVARRFKLQNGAFQLKYLDDEEEWVMLVSDSDLQECLEILDCLGTHIVKFLVRDTPYATGSSGSSNCFLAGSS